MHRPNILMIVPHDLGDYLGCYGRSVRTPRLDEVAQEGARFTSHFTTSPFCSPARGSLITAQYPHSNGLMGLVNYGWDLGNGVVPDGRRFSEAGYRTFLVGFQHETSSVSKLGFEVVDDDKHEVEDVAGTVAKLVTDLAGHRGDARRPFYMRIGTTSVHRYMDPASSNYGYEPGVATGIGEKAVDVLPQWADTPGLRRDLNGFTGEVARFDKAVGTIMDALRRTGLEDDTIVVFAPDHGVDYPRAKGTLYDLGIRTALLMRWPRRIQEGTVVDGLTSHIDVVPTLLELAGMDAADHIEGVSLVPLLDGAQNAVRDAIFAEESTFPKNLMRCIRTTRFKLVRNVDHGRRSDAVVCGGCQFMRENGDTYFVERPDTEFYDLEQDPDEMVNLAGRPQYAVEERELREQLASWMGSFGRPARPSTERELLLRRAPWDRNEHGDLIWK